MAYALAQAESGKTPLKLTAPSEWQALKNWVLVWVFLANAGFAITYVFGSPPRYSEIVLFAVIGLLVRNRSYLTQCSAFIAAMAYSVLSYIAGLFNLGINSLAHSVLFFSELNFGQSLEYTVGSVIVLTLTGLACVALRRSTAFESSKMIGIAVVVTLALAAFDFYMGMGMRGHYKRVPNANAPFESAIEQAGVPDGTSPLDRNLVVIMVESLGVPTDNEEMSRLLFARFQDKDVARRFEVSSGTTTYFGSTTAGEIRELCGRWGDYHALTSERDDTCLPAKLAQAGAPTTAYHSFEGTFFDRHLWYPNIGFEKTAFRDDLVERGASKCGGVFPGACDRDIPQQIAEQLKSTNEPQFIYWLTVNAHLPVPLEGNLEAENCERVSKKLADEYPMICRQFAIWDTVDNALAGELLQDDFPPTDILIVGDHMPPYFDRHSRAQFAPDRVPWIVLKWRERVE